MSDGMGVSGSQNVQFQPAVDAGKSQSSDQVGKSSTGRTITSIEGKNTKGLIISDGNVKPNFKSSPLRALTDRVIQKVHQLGKTWVKVSDSQLKMLNQVKNTEVKQTAESAANTRNSLVQELQDLEQEVGNLEKEVSQFKKDFGEVLKFRNKNHPASADFKQNKSFVYPTADGGAKVRTFTSDVKSIRQEQAEDLHDMLKKDPGIKARFSEHNGNKHDLAVKNKQIAGIKEQLYQAQKQTKSTFSKAADELYKEQKVDFKATRETIKEQVTKGYESQRDIRKQGYQETKEYLRGQYDKKHDEKVEVRKLKANNKRELKETEKKIGNSESKLGDLLAKVAKKVMKDDQRAEVFKESEKVSPRKQALMQEKIKLQKDRQEIKETESALKKDQKDIKNELWDRRKELKGSNRFQDDMKDLGIRTKLGRQAWGDLGKLKNKRNQGIDKTKENYKASKADAKKARKQNKEDLESLASGKTKATRKANVPQERPPVFEYRADTMLQKFSDNAFEQDLEWKSEITTMLDHAQVKELKLLEDTLRLWTVDPDNAGDYADILDFINKQRNLRSP